MIRFFLTLLLTLAISFSAFYSTAQAGDSAERQIIGFSPDGRWFAFEEFGISDGSGAPYSSIYVINVNTDKWANGTPIRTFYGEQVAPVSAARKITMKKAQGILKTLNIIEPGVLLASNPVTEITANPRRIDFYRHMSLANPTNKMSYVLKEIDFPSRETCKLSEIKEKGFSLSFTRGGSPLQQVYKDKSIPKSRHCPMRYSISDVIEFNPESAGPTRHIILIHMFSRGFEGPDSRFLAVPVTLP